MERINQKMILSTAGRILLAVLFTIMAVHYFVMPDKIDTVIAHDFVMPYYMVIITGIVWFLIAASFFMNKAVKLSGTVLIIMVIIILALSTSRGFESKDTFVPTLLAFAFYISFIGGALMVMSNDMERHAPMREDVSDTMFIVGRILAGLFFAVAGFLHMINIKYDAAMLNGMPNAEFWVVFVGICWFATALSFWSNLMSRTSALLASLMILIITFMINIHAFGNGGDINSIVQLAKNTGLIGVCLLVASRGKYWF